MTPSEFNSLRDMLKKESGLVLSDDKQYLVESRLGPVAKRLEYKDVATMVADWYASKKPNLQNQIVEAMTINESFFFRDKTPFDNFKDITLPGLIEQKARTRHIRIWSAAASTGQEAYSLAMILNEHKHLLEGWRIEILGTDLCSEALAKAKSGLYSQFEVQRGMPVTYLVKNFKQVGTMWQLDPSITSMVKFSQFNLMNSFASLGKFDVIFCRNVLIYFDRDTKADILSRMENQSNPGCHLVLGASETLVGLNSKYSQINSARGLYEFSNSEPADRAISTAANTAARSPQSNTRPANKTGTTGLTFSR